MPKELKRRNSNNSNKQFVKPFDNPDVAHRITTKTAKEQRTIRNRVQFAIIPFPVEMAIYLTKVQALEHRDDFPRSMNGGYMITPEDYEMYPVIFVPPRAFANRLQLPKGYTAEEVKGVVYFNSRGKALAVFIFVGDNLPLPPSEMSFRLRSMEYVASERIHSLFLDTGRVTRLVHTGYEPQHFHSFDYGVSQYGYHYYLHNSGEIFFPLQTC